MGVDAGVSQGSPSLRGQQRAPQPDSLTGNHSDERGFNRANAGDPVETPADERASTAKPAPTARTDRSTRVTAKTGTHAKDNPLSEGYPSGKRHRWRRRSTGGHARIGGAIDRGPCLSRA